MRREGAIVRAYELESVADGADRLGVSRTYLYRLMKRGDLDYYEIGNRKLVHRRDIDYLIQKRAS